VERAWAARTVDAPFIRPGAAEFDALPSVSIDVAVMEPCAADPEHPIPLRLVPLEAGWSDLGSWEAVWQALPRDEAGNAVQGDVLLADTHNSLVQAGHRLVAVAGLDDVVVVETSDAVLVTRREASQSVKDLVQQLVARHRPEGECHRLVHRPWGWYEGIATGPRFQVKRIIVKPGASLSLQMHHHRAEHWIIVAGTAEVRRGDETFLLTENQSTYIPLGERHQLSNPGRIPLEIIEIQSGPYLGEDDIVRFGDRYGRR
jgi:mannose-1-phosphate guanylyltransferase/mannose-6-phosphate isomerase